LGGIGSRIMNKGYFRWEENIRQLKRLKSIETQDEKKILFFPGCNTIITPIAY